MRVRDRNGVRPSVPEFSNALEFSVLSRNYCALELGGGKPPIDSDGTIYLFGTISDVAVVSARICLECAALEL